MLDKLMSSLSIQRLCPDLRRPSNCAKDFMVFAGEGIYYSLLGCAVTWKLRSVFKSRSQNGVYVIKMSIA